MPIFGTWLRKNIFEKGMTITAVARKTGISREHLYKIMAGESGTKIETVDAIATSIGVSTKEARQIWYSSMDAIAPKPIEEIQYEVGEVHLSVNEDKSRYLDRDGMVVKEVNPTIEMLDMMSGLVEKVDRLERRMEQSSPATLVELDGKGGQKVTEFKGETGVELQRRIADLQVKLDEVLAALAAK